MDIHKKQNINILIVMVLISSIFTAMMVQADSNTIISFEDTMIPRGSTKNIDLFINDVDNLGSFEIKVSWDPAVIEVKEVNGKQGFEVAPYIVNDNGYVNIAAYTLENITGSVQPATFKIKAIGDVGESCLLNIDKSELLTADPSPDQISHTKDHGLIEVDEQDTSGGSSGGGGGGLPPPPANTPPVCDASLSQTTGFVGEPIDFDGSESFDTDGSIISYNWNFSDGKSATGMMISHQYMQAGTYEVSLTIKDDDGASASDTITVFIQASANNPPSKPEIMGPNMGSINQSYEFSFSASDDDEDMLKFIINWGDETSETTDFFDESKTIKLTHQWMKAGRYIITAQTDDNLTLSASTTTVVLIDAMELYFDDEMIGVITDTDSDSIYDRYDDNPDQIKYNKANDRYMIDVDDDSKWDYTYDETSDEMTLYEGKGDTQQTSDLSWLLIIGVIAIIAVIGIGFYLMQSKQKKK